MKYTEIAELGVSELQEKLGEKKKELFELKLKLKTIKEEVEVERYPTIQYQP